RTAPATRRPDKCPEVIGAHCNANRRRVRAPPRSFRTACHHPGRMTWWESWFGEEYLELYPHRDLASARREAAFALARLDPEPMPLLDLCCGSGRHSTRFAEKGFAPVGLDYSAQLLDLARA